MNRIILALSLAAFTVAASAQTTAKGSSSTHPASTAKAAAKSAATAPSAPEPWIKLPRGVPRVAHGPVKMPFALHYEDIKIGTGPVGEAGKLWHIKYTGWRAADGVKFDSWDEHTQPIIGKDGKPELGPDGKPTMGDPEPIAFPQGVGRVIPGFDYGLEGMRIGGKRRIFIPWQMAYGTRNIPDRPDHPGIPPKSDLIFDVELVDMTDMPQHQYPPMPSAQSHPGESAQPHTAPAAPEAKPTQPAQPAAPATSPKPAAPQPAAPAQPQTQPK